LSAATFPVTLLSGINVQVASRSLVNEQLIVVRFTLLAVSLLSFYIYARKLAERYGAQTATFFLLFTATQFHVPFYISRTLPNFLGLPVVLIGLSQFISSDAPGSSGVEFRTGAALLVAAGIIARAEIGVLCGTILIVDVLLSRSPRQYTLKVLPAILGSAVVSCAATLAFDSFVWRDMCFPELQGLLFNVVEGKASEWGVQPWYYYLTSMAKLLLNPILIPRVLESGWLTYSQSTSFLDALRKLRYIVIVPVLYVLGMSLLPHKEWRFVVYVIPLLTTSAAFSTAYISTHRSKSLIYRTQYVLTCITIPLTLLVALLMTLISSTNYPGALALQHLHSSVTLPYQNVYLSIPVRMTGATLPLCTHSNWTYTKCENSTELSSKQFWSKIDYALISSLEDVPCRVGKGMEGQGEWELVYSQCGYAGPTMKEVSVPWDVDWLPGKLKVPWVRWENKAFVVRRLGKEELALRRRLWEEEKEKERAGVVGKLGEVEGQWRDFY
jgi:alpha-1,6-mannosyltransferase